MAQLFKMEEIPVKDLQALGLHDGKKHLLDRQTQDALLKGHLTKFMHLTDLDIGGSEKVSIDAKLSLRRKADGNVALSVHPIYKRPLIHPNLTGGEARDFAKGGVHMKPTSAYGRVIDFGTAPYQFEPKNRESFFIKLEKSNGETMDVWGIDLDRALEKSGHGKGDMVQLNFLGKEEVTVEVDIRDRDGNVIGSEFKMVDRNNWEISDYNENRKLEKAIIYEFDHETNSFVTIDEDNVLTPDEINGARLSPEQKRDLKKGKAVALDDGTEVRVSPRDGWESNKRLLIASMIFDGGLSFALYHAIRGISRLVGNSEIRNLQVDNHYTNGYRDALKKVLADLEGKQAKFPDDAQIAKDLDIIKQEFQVAQFHKPVAGSSDVGTRNVQSNANDSELERNARQRQEMKQESGIAQSEHPAHSRDATEQESRSVGRGR